jgi:hypothetical protein
MTAAFGPNPDIKGIKESFFCRAMAVTISFFIKAV